METASFPDRDGTDSPYITAFQPCPHQFCLPRKPNASVMEQLCVAEDRESRTSSLNSWPGTVLSLVSILLLAVTHLWFPMLLASGKCCIITSSGCQGVIRG